VQLIAYYRVSTAQQARAARSPGPLLDPGYRAVVPALEAQRAAVERLRRELVHRWGVVELIGAFTEIEPSPHRPQLTRALSAARERDAVVVVARLHRLGSDADLLARLEREALQLEREAEWGGGFGGFLFADLPGYAFERPGELRWAMGLAASLARLERDNAAQRIREGLAAAKARGAKLGGLRPGTLKENARAKEAAASRSEALRPILAAMAAQGASLRAMARALYAAGTRTAKGEALSPTHVRRHLERLGLIA
jgi:DNA invertase Pin-like site-specific DNA recombinase